MDATLQLELPSIPAPTIFEKALAIAVREAKRAKQRARELAHAAADAMRRVPRQLDLKLAVRVARDLSEGWRVALELTQKFKAKIERYASRWHLPISEFLSALQLDIYERWAAGKVLNLATIFGHARDLVKAPLVKSAKQKGKPTSTAVSLTLEDGAQQELEGGADPQDLAIAAEAEAAPDGHAEKVLALARSCNLESNRTGMSARTARRRRAECRRALGITGHACAESNKATGLAYTSGWKDSKLGGWWQPQPQDGRAFTGFGRREAKGAV